MHFQAWGIMHYAAHGKSQSPIDKFRTAPYRSGMTNINESPVKGAEEARSTLPAILDRAERGTSTVISRHGRPVAAVVPIELYQAIQRIHEPKRRSLLSLGGSGAGLWGEDSARAIRELRDEWSR